MNATLIILGVLAVAAAAALLFWREPVLVFAGRAGNYFREVRTEIRKVSWPTPEDLRKSTTVIIIFVAVIGFVLGIVDWLLSKLLIDVLGRAFG